MKRKEQRPASDGSAIPGRLAVFSGSQSHLSINIFRIQSAIVICHPQRKFGVRKWPVSDRVGSFANANHQFSTAPEDLRTQIVSLQPRRKFCERKLSGYYRTGSFVDANCPFTTAQEGFRANFVSLQSRWRFCDCKLSVFNRAGNFANANGRFGGVAMVEALRCHNQLRRCSIRCSNVARSQWEYGIHRAGASSTLPQPLERFDATVCRQWRRPVEWLPM